MEKVILGIDARWGYAQSHGVKAVIYLHWQIQIFCKVIFTHYFHGIKGIELSWLRFFYLEN